MIPITITLVKLSAIGSSHVSSRDLARELNRLLAELGNSEFNQARKALAHAEVSTTPERELTLAIGHLQSADGHFEQACRREGNLATNALFSALERSHWKKATPSYQMRIACKASIATIYWRLNQPPLVQRYADEIVAIFPGYSEAVVNTYKTEFIQGEPYYRAGANVAAAHVLEEAKEAKSSFVPLGWNCPKVVSNTTSSSTTTGAIS
jgi:hypothetical protein